MGNNTEAKKRAVEKYNKKTYDKITIRVRKEETETIKTAATKAGYSLNMFCLEAIREKMNGK